MQLIKQAILLNIISILVNAANIRKSDKSLKTEVNYEYIGKCKN